MNFCRVSEGAETELRADQRGVEERRDDRLPWVWTLMTFCLWRWPPAWSPSARPFLVSSAAPTWPKLFLLATVPIVLDCNSRRRDPRRRSTRRGTRDPSSPDQHPDAEARLQTYIQSAGAPGRSTTTRVGPTIWNLHQRIQILGRWSGVCFGQKTPAWWVAQVEHRLT